MIAIGKPQLRPFFASAVAFKNGTDTPRLFLERCIEAIDASESKIGAFVTANFVGARAEADESSARWASNKPLSIIDGMPVAIKDIMETADMPTEQGSLLFAGWRGGRDAAAVAALREAGAVVIGKTVTTEFAAAQARGTRNPWDLMRTPGGSSSGSAAAVGAGMNSRGAWHPGRRINYPSGKFLRMFWLQAKHWGYQSRRQFRRIQPELHGCSRGGSFRSMERCSRDFCPRWRRSGLPRYFWPFRTALCEHATADCNAPNGRMEQCN